MANNKIQPFRFGIVEETEENCVIEIKQEDYERDLESGIPEDELLRPGKHKFRRVPPELRATKADLHLSNTKVEFQMKLDLDVLKHFRNQAESEEIEVLQLLLNEKLRNLMESEKQIEEVETKLLKDKKFIAVLAEEVRKAA